MRLLLVEDHHAFRETFAYLLEKGLDIERVVQASSATEGLQAADEDGIDVAILDLLLPDGHGANLIRQMHAKNPGMPVLAITASLDPDEHRRALKAGAGRVLTKELPFEEFVAAIKSSLPMEDGSGHNG